MSKPSLSLCLLLIIALTAACGSPQPAETPVPVMTLENVTPSLLVSTPDQVLLQLSDPATDLTVAVSFDLPEGWEITVLQVLQGTAADYRDALQTIIASAKVVE